MKKIKNQECFVEVETMKMNKRTLLLIAAGLLVGSLAGFGLAFAFGTVNGTHDADIPDNNDANNNDDLILEDDVDPADDIDVDQDAIADAGRNDTDSDHDFIGLIPEYFSISGVVISIDVIDNKIRLTIEDEHGNPAVLVLSENTVFPFVEELAVGDEVTGWYVTNAPMIAIWPAEYNIAVLVAGAPEGSRIKVDRFNVWADSTEGLMISQDKMFAFRIGEDTQVILANGDDFTGGDIGNRRIVVIYDVSTRSIPEITTARKLIVLYEDIMPLG